MKKTMLLALVACLIGQTTAFADQPEWARVRPVAPGTRILVKVTQSAGAARQLPAGYFVAAGDDEVFLLNIADGRLPIEARRVLFDLCTREPDVLIGALKRETTSEKIVGNVRVNAEGVFVAGNRVAAIADVVQRLARSDVVEIKITTGSPHTFWGDFGGLLLTGITLTAAIAGGVMGHRQFAHHKALGGLLGSLGGFVLGTLASVLLLHTVDHSHVIYRADGGR